MRRWCSVLAVATAAGFVAPAAPYQVAPHPTQQTPASKERDKRTSGGQVPGSAIIVQQDAVQKELKLTPDQRKAIHELPQVIKKKFEADFEAMYKLQGEERRAKSAEIREKHTAEFPKALDEVLTQTQRTRFKQLQLQHRGGDAFTQKEVIAALQLSEEQQSQIKEITRQRVKTNRKELLNQIDKVLDDTQRKRWAELVGAPFEFKSPDPEPAIEKSNARTIDPKLTVGSREWVDACIEAWKPNEDETRITQIGWAKTIQQAKELAKEHRRPVFLFNFSGRIEQNRC